MNSPGPLISAEQLAIWLGFISTTEMKPSSVVVVDCRFSLAEPGLGRSQYEAGHVPGAFYLDLNHDLSNAAPPGTPGGRHPLPDIETFAAKMRALGIGPRTWVVAYDDSRFAFASRLWWMLRYLGHEQVAVLDGGWQGWVDRPYSVSEGLPPELTATSEKKMGTFKPQPNPEMWVDRTAVKAFCQGSEYSPQKLDVEALDVKELDAESARPLSNVMLVDSRSPNRYQGKEEPIDPVAGHIPGAINAFWKGVTDEMGVAFSWPEQRDRWKSIMAESIGSTPEEIWVYCGSGVTACVNLLSLELAGISNSKLYVGSWSDWCAVGGAIALSPDKT